MRPLKYSDALYHEATIRKSGMRNLVFICYLCGAKAVEITNHAIYVHDCFLNEDSTHLTTRQRVLR